MASKTQATGTVESKLDALIALMTAQAQASTPTPKPANKAQAKAQAKSETATLEAKVDKMSAKFVLTDAQGHEHVIPCAYEKLTAQNKSVMFKADRKNNAEKILVLAYIPTPASK